MVRFVVSPHDHSCIIPQIVGASLLKCGPTNIYIIVIFHDQGTVNDNIAVTINVIDADV